MTTLTTSTTPAAVGIGHWGGRIVRGLGRGLGLVVAVVAGLAAAGAGYEAVASRGDARAYPPPCQLVDVDGYRLHL
jgi:hypothetical protein